MKLFNRELSIDEVIGFAKVMAREKQCGGCLLVDCANDLAEEIARLKDGQQWIPVTERLPEVDKYGDINVIVHMDDGFIYAATYDKNNGWELWADSGEVTHWMPLPQPPTAK